MDQQFIKGIPFSTLEYAKAISLLKGWLHEQQEKPRFVVTANPEIVMSAKENTEKSKQFKKMLLSADLTRDLIKYCNDNEYRVFLFGAAPESNKKALEKLNEQFPGAQFKGQHGFVNGEEIEKIKIKIKQFKPHLLLVGLGSPKQEEFIYENIQTLNVPLSIGIGGMIDIISGTVKRAPKMMRDTGTEWLYRLLSQPKRLKRQLVLPKFLLSVMLERVKGMPS
ncbi:TPA: WecB/TagA/CpsF family glycosyltransferase [Bacillus thuringiensis]|uniref:WecB/TagA/CpsF family glycosyltransferase n=1 Tax=Bacillus cereus TaxID=1396 RepID=UPI0014444776|nr:WecB/TagA/CpsF family glycosyltransferase [Bacillus cereus]HDR7738267.1 WecB/TagA/CpsF family glycosyltransferase [Bacillus thuringiensis]